MAAAIALRSNFTGADRRRLARRTQVAKHGRRLLALASIYDGGSRRDAARNGDVGLQIIRMMRFYAEGPDGRIDRKATGLEPRLNDGYSTALKRPYRRLPWRAALASGRSLPVIVGEEFGVSIARQTLSRELHSLVYRKLTARPRHRAQAEGAIEHFRKVFLPPCRNRAGWDIGRAAIEIWFADEARIGQKNKIIRRWAKCMLRSILRMHIRR